MKTFSLEAEQAVLGGMMLAGEKGFRVVEPILDANDFFSDQHRFLFTLIQETVERKMPLDPVSVSEVATSEQLEIIGGMPYLTEVCKSTPSFANVKAYASIVLEQSQTRGLSATGQEIMVLAGGDESAAEKIAKAQELTNNLGNKSATDDKDSSQAAKEFVEWMQRTESGIDSGYFEKHTGGLFAGLIVIAAGTGQGKSTLALNMAYKLRDKHIAYYSLEMPAAQLMGRMLSNHTGIQYSKVRDKELNEGEWNIFGQGVSDIRSSNIRFVDNGIHINQLCAHARAMKNNNGLDVVIVDYIQLVGSDGQTREREVANITRKLKGLSMDLDIPVIALSQLSRDHEKRNNPKPGLRDLRESGAIEQDSDLVIFLYDESRYKENSDNKGLTLLYSEKYRHGENFEVTLEQQLQCFRFGISDRHWMNQASNVVNL